MPEFILSPLMSMPVPIVGVAPGPNYASDVNNCLSILDSHNHSFGNGTQITPSGLNISTDLSFLSNNAVNLRSTRFIPQSGVLSGLNDLSCAYSVGTDGDLYYNDGNGNNIQITDNGGVAGSPGSIANLVSPASASYSSGTVTFIWQSNANTPANMDAGSYIIRNVTAGSNGITLSAPNALASNYTLTLPASLPGSTSFLTVDSSGNVGTTTNITSGNIVDGSITQQKLAPRTTGTTVGTGGVAVSNSSGSYVQTTALETPVTNLSVTITTTGRPVMVFLKGVANNDSYVAIAGGASATASINIKNSTLGTSYGNVVRMNTTGFIPASSYQQIDMGVNGVPGTYTYDITAACTVGGTTLQVEQVQLVAYEL